MKKYLFQAKICLVTFIVKRQENYQLKILYIIFSNSFRKTTPQFSKDVYVPNWKAPLELLSLVVTVSVFLNVFLLLVGKQIQYGSYFIVVIPRLEKQQTSAFFKWHVLLSCLHCRVTKRKKFLCHIISMGQQNKKPNVT